jgi:hypothetical protein
VVVVETTEVLPVVPERLEVQAVAADFREAVEYYQLEEPVRKEMPEEQGLLAGMATFKVAVAAVLVALDLMAELAEQTVPVVAELVHYHLFLAQQLIMQVAVAAILVAPPLPAALAAAAVD